MQDNKDKISEENIANISKHIADTKIKNKIKKIDKIKRGLIIKKYSKDFFYIIVGCFIMAMGTSLFTSKPTLIWRVCRNINNYLLFI